MNMSIRKLKIAVVFSIVLSLCSVALTFYVLQTALAIEKALSWTDLSVQRDLGELRGSLVYKGVLSGWRTTPCVDIDEDDCSELDPEQSVAPPTFLLDVEDINRRILALEAKLGE